jgi:hypothetical protein
LHVGIADVDLQFNLLIQLDRFVEVLSARPPATSGRLSSKRQLLVRPNSHWLRRLLAKLKAKMERLKPVNKLRAVQQQLSPLENVWQSYSRHP